MSFTITEDCQVNLLNAIENYLLTNRNKNDQNKIYFSGEYGNLTKFESSSNNLKIGVIASNEIEGLILLRLLRIIIDDVTHLFPNWESYYDDEEWDNIYKNDNKIDLSDYIKRLSKSESNFMTKFNLDEKICVNLIRYSRDPPNTKGIVVEYEVTKTLDEIDIWTLPRIMKEIINLY
jgi:hypothetical protein